MKYRSPFTVILLSLISLGFYDLYWFGQTRNDLAKKVKINLRANSWLFLIGVLRAVALVSLVWAVFLLFDTQKPVDVSPECQQEHTLSMLPDTKGTYPYTATCRQQIAAADAHNTEVGHFFLLGATALVAGVLANTIILPKWLMPYVTAAQSVTSGAVHAFNSMSLLLFYETRGIALLQQGYNDPLSIPAAMGKDLQPSLKMLSRRVDDPNLKRVLMIVAVTMIAGFVLLVGWIVFVMVLASA